MPASQAHEAARVFRLDNESLAFRFTATVVDRGGAREERLTTPARLRLWLSANGLGLGATAAPSEQELAEALALREAIHRAGAALAAGRSAAARDVARINAASQAGAAQRVLERGRLRWVGDVPLRDALGVLAGAAVETLGGPDREHVKACEGAWCGGLYVDTSRGQNRRWCSMNFCGNRAKKAALSARRGAPG